MTDRSAFGHDTTGTEVLAGIDLSGKRALVTGGASGLGAETARALASAGADVTITVRNLDRATAVLDKIRQQTGRTVAAEQLELGSLASIRAFAERIHSAGRPINILINNAGVMACPLERTDDGFERHFGVNHLGHFLLTNLIARSFAEIARVVTLSSAGHDFSPVNFGDPNFCGRAYDKWAAYGQSKTANALFAVELNRRLAPRGIESFSVHPGVVPTNLSRHFTRSDIRAYQRQLVAGDMRLKSISQGVATILYAATAPELTDHGGAYLADCRIASVAENGDRYTTVKPHAVDPLTAARLWSISEVLTGQALP